MTKGFRRTSIFLGERHSDLFNRGVARVIDLVVGFAIYIICREVWVPLGMLGATFAVAVQDGLWAGQSPGKRLMGLKVVEDQLGLPCRMSHSILRNVPFFLIFPCIALPWGGILLCFLVVPLIFLETYLILSLESGVRLGDVLGNTLVIENVEEALGQFDAQQ